MVELQDLRDVKVDIARIDRQNLRFKFIAQQEMKIACIWKN